MKWWSDGNGVQLSFISPKGQISEGSMGRATAFSAMLLLTHTNPISFIICLNCFFDFYILSLAYWIDAELHYKRNGMWRTCSNKLSLWWFRLWRALASLPCTTHGPRINLKSSISFHSSRRISPALVSLLINVSCAYFITLWNVYSFLTMKLICCQNTWIRPCHSSF